MSVFNLKSGKIVTSSDCVRFQDYWENQDDQHISSYDPVDRGEVKDSDYFTSKHLGYSDYSGTIYGKSNQQIILEEFGHLDGVLQIYGGYSYSDVFIRIDVLDSNEDLQSMIFGLEDYPIIDEDRLSEVEEEAKEEAMRNWVLYDFRRLLQKRWNYDFSHLNDKFLRWLFHSCEEKTNAYWSFEYTDAYISVGQIVDKLSQKEFLIIFKSVKEEFSKNIKEQS